MNAYLNTSGFRSEAAAKQRKQQLVPFYHHLRQEMQSVSTGLLYNSFMEPHSRNSTRNSLQGTWQWQARPSKPAPSPTHNCHDCCTSMQQRRSNPLPLKRPTRETDWFRKRQAVTHQKATASSDKAAGYWERKQATGKGSRLLGKGAGCW